MVCCSSYLARVRGIRDNSTSFRFFNRCIMAIRTIIYLPDPRLRQISKNIEIFDEELQNLISDMFETMYDARGVGLAAPQIGINLRLSVIDTSENKTEQLVLVNPEIIAAEGEDYYTEGCLSVPGTYDKVKRAQKVKVRAQNAKGE